MHLAVTQGFGGTNDSDGTSGKGGLVEERLACREACTRGRDGALSREARELREMRRFGTDRERHSGLAAPSQPSAEPVADASPAPDAPEQTPAVDPVAAYPSTGVEAAICAYEWECSIALRVARCESGQDYIAGYNASGHAGTFQISPIHAWRFSKRGLDFWTDATILEVNLEVAFEIYQERWWWAWSCF